MKVFSTSAALIALCSLVLSCGGGSMGPGTLLVQPPSANIFTDFENGTHQAVMLTATGENGIAPAEVQWTTSQACVAISSHAQNTAVIICNFTCGAGTLTATITASAQGATGTSSVACTWG